MGNAWSEMRGKPVEEVEAYFTRKGYYVQVVPEHAPVRSNLRSGRVRLRVNTQNRVMNVPREG